VVRETSSQEVAVAAAIDCIRVAAHIIEMSAEQNDELRFPASDELASLPSVDLFLGFEDQTLDGAEKVNLLRLKSIETDDPERRFRIVLHSAFTMMLNVTNPQKPFAPRAIWADGRRSACLEDFDAKHIEVLAAIAGDTGNPSVRARLFDIAWFRQRSLYEAGRLAATAYLEAAEQLDEGLESYKYYARCLTILRSLKWPEPLSTIARDAVRQFQAELADSEWQGLFARTTDLAIEHSLFEPVELAKSLEAYASSQIKGYPDETWLRAARLYRQAKDQSNEYRCVSQAAESNVRRTEDILTRGGLALEASHWLETALQNLHGYPQARARRQEILDQLHKLQERIPGEMQTYTDEYDAKPIIESLRDQFDLLSLKDSLFEFARLASPPPADEALKEAREHSKNYFSGLFASIQVGNRGKTQARSPGFSSSGKEYERALEAKAVELRSMQRAFVTRPGILFALHHIRERYHVSEEVLASLLRESPFVPPEHIRTIVRGFEHMFNSDWTSASHILIPMLEAILRHVLRLNGKIVSTFDNASGTQEDMTITRLFDKMRDDLDEVFSVHVTTEIERLFLTEHGPQLRHQIAHALGGDGLLSSSDTVYACVFLFWLTCFPLYRHQDDLEIEEIGNIQSKLHRS
jgi:hypothetical protein